MSLETDLQSYEWDVSDDQGEAIIIIDQGDVTVYLTYNDLAAMLEALA